MSDMSTLYFAGREKILVKENLTEEDNVFELIKDFIHSLNPDYKIPYFRSWGKNPVVFDVGSHTEFFELHLNKGERN